MVTIHTISGCSYCYDSNTNEIIQGDCGQQELRRDVRMPSFVPEFGNFDTIILNITDACNLRCRYCCYTCDYRDTRKHREKSLSPEQIDDALLFLKQNARQKTVRVGFYGGECLLYFDRVQYAIEKAEALFGESVSFFMTTNGTLLTEDAADWLFHHDVQINVSLDGTREHNDRYRVSYDGRGSFDIVHKNLSIIKNKFPEKWMSSIAIMMTLPDRDRILRIAEDWSKDSVLKDKAPAQVSALAPNYDKGVELIEVEGSISFMHKVIDEYERHPDYLVLKAYLEGITRELYERPIYPADAPISFSACVPNNRKLFVDSVGDIGICEKMPDAFRVGSLKIGIDWQKVKSIAETMYAKRKGRCDDCEFVRLCDICPTSIDLRDDEMETFCHNQRAGLKVQLAAFCELAERGLIYG